MAMRFVLDSWAAEYGSSREQELTDAKRPVDAGRELAVDQWRPIDPRSSGGLDPDQTSQTVLFVDGVRRIDARIWIADNDGGLDQPGVCASVAAGVVSCRLDGPRGQAQVEQVEVERALFTAVRAESIELSKGPHSGGLGFGSYKVRTLRVPESDDPGAAEDALYLAVHRHMSDLENRVAVELVEQSSEKEAAVGPIIFDGPLGTRTGATSVGYVKTQHVQYLQDPNLAQVLADLPEGFRTPVFYVGGELANWSWYLRLPGPRSHTLSGIVRLELPGLGTIEDAVVRADEVSVLLPRFSSEAHKDQRAPQNLYPIAGLERELRRRLGDARLLDRALRRAARPV